MRTHPRRVARCTGCRAAKHTACERRLISDAKCVCQCLDDDGRLKFWALVETARTFPESVAAHSMIVGSIHICPSRDHR